MFYIDKNPEISIVVPVYNTGKYKLVRCLESIREQTFEDYEVLLIDDGSSDKSGELCEEFCKSDSRFRVFHQHNSGVSAARNKGICESKGTYLCFIDSDDYVKSEYLELLYTSIKKENAELSVCGIEILTEKGMCIFTQQREALFCSINAKNVDLMTIELLLENGFFNYAYGKLYLGAVVRNNNLRFNVDFSLGEDTWFVMDYLRHINYMVVSGQVQYLYIKYGIGTLTSQKSVDKYLKLMDVNCHIEETFFQKNWISDGIIKKIDERKMMCAEWAIQAVEQEKSWKNKVTLTKQILNSRELLNSLKRNGKEIVGNRTELRLLMTKMPEKILICRNAERCWKRYRDVLRRKIHHLANCVRNRK